MIIKNIINKLHFPFKKKTIVFISFHKCATSFFSSYILKQTNDMEQIDYAKLLYNNTSNINVKIEPYGKIYGVIRILDEKHPSFNVINNFLLNSDLDKVNIIFWTRDPRDILVSMYYSFGFSHGLSNDPLISKYQQERREKIQNMTLDEYVLNEAEVIIKKFEIMKKMMEEKKNYILLSYEEMINDFDSFFSKLSAVIPLDKTKKNKIFEETRPQTSENQYAHKRKGSVGSYKEKLKASTIAELNKKLFPLLIYFQYEKAPL